jgi:putative oxidoreductase
MYETIVGAGIPFPHVMTYFVSSVEFVCGCLLIIGLLSTLCCIAFIIDMIVAITTVQVATILRRSRLSTGLTISCIFRKSCTS